MRTRFSPTLRSANESDHKKGLLFHDHKVYRSELTITWKRHDIPINVSRPRPLTVLCFDLYYESNMYLLTEWEDRTGK